MSRGKKRRGIGMKTIDVTLNNKLIHKYQKGYPLLEESSISDWSKVTEEGTLLNLYSQRKEFVAKAYYGRQNKGFGWVLSESEDETIDQVFFEKRIKSAIKHRKKYNDDATTNAYRLLNGEGDGIGGLTIDYLDGHYLITWYSKGIYQFKEMILGALEEVVDYKSIYEKKRFDAKGQYVEDDDFVKGERPEFPLLVLENGVKFAVYLNDGPMIGFFLDQKEVRKTLRDKYVKDKDVLNTFSYTGAFSVYAALGGAKSTTSVDLANRSRSKTKEQFEINNIDLTNQHIIVEDVFNYFKYAVRKELSFDVVILDPPSFARSKKHTFSVFKDYKNLLGEAIAITKKGGTIIASTNYSNAGMTWFKDSVKKAFANTGETYQITESFTLPHDFKVNPCFKEGNYLKVLFIKKL